MKLAQLAIFALTLAAAAAVPLGNYSSHSVLGTPAAIEITDDVGHHLRLRAYGDDMIRVQASESETFSPDDRYLMVEHHNHGGALTILRENASSLVIANGNIRLTVAKSPLRLSFANASGNVLLSDSSGIDLDPATLRYVFTPDANEKFIGYGQKRLSLQDTFQLAGRTERRNYGEEGFPGRGAQGVLIVPFYMSSKGYGFYANTTFTHEGRFNNAGDYSFRVELKNFAPPEADYFFIYGPQPAAILDRYTQLTGRPRMPRKAIFGIHLSDNEPSQPTINQSWWQTKVDAHHAAGLPLDHMIYDNDWRAASPLIGGVVGQWGGSQFAFEPTRYPDPATFRTWYDAKGLMLTLDLNLNNCNDSAGWQHSYNIQPTSTPTNTKTTDTSDPDYSNPAVRSWLWQLLWDKALNPALGYPGDAIWLDESDGIWRQDNQLLANGRPWHEMKNYYFFLTAQAAVAEGWDNAEGGAIPGIGEAKRPWVWIRGGSPGMQRYATHWTGDIDFTEAFYRGSLVGMQASGLCGFPFFNHDAGGFGTNSSNPDPAAQIPGPNDTYYTEWGMGVGSFSPIWRPHGYNNPRWPLHRNNACQDAFRLYGTMRYEMMPYIYGIAHQAHETGLPMARAMALVYPDQPNAWLPAQEFQYHWGDAFLVAPPLNLGGVTEIRTAWMPPAAKWYDYWTDAPVSVPTSGGFHTFNTVPGKLPLFVKAGSIIPRNDFAVSTKFLSDAKLTLDVYAGAPGSYVLVEDDGATERFRIRNEKRTTTFTYSEPAGKPTFEIAAASGTYQGASPNRSTILRLRGLSLAPAAVLVDGVSYAILPAPLPAGTGNAAAWDAPNKQILVRLSERPVSSTASVVVTPGAPSGGANLAFEPFDYSEAVGTAPTGLDGGTGWDEAYPAPNNATVRLAEGLAYPGLTTVGKALEFGANGDLRAGRDWADSAAPPADGTVWYSFLVKPATGGRGTFIPFKSTTSGDGQNGFGLRIDNNAGSPQFKAWNPLQGAGPSLDFSGGYGQTYFILGKVVINSSGNSTNTIWAYQNPTPIPAAEPTGGGSTVSSGWSGNAETLRTTLSGRAFSNNTSLIYDEVRIADGFAALFGTTPVDTTPIFTLTPSSAVGGQTLELAWRNIPAGATINGNPVSEGAGSSSVPAPLENTLYTLNWTTPPLGTLTQSFTAIPPAFTLGASTGYEGDPLTLDWQVPVGCTAITLQPGNINLLPDTTPATGIGSRVIEAPAGPGTEFTLTYVYQETPATLTQSFTTRPNFLDASATHAVQGQSPASFTWKIPGTWNENPVSGDNAVFLRYGPPSSFTTGSPAPIQIDVSAKTDTSGFSASPEVITPQAGQTEYRLYYRTGGSEQFITTTIIVGPQLFTFNVVNSTNASEITFSPSTLHNGVKAYADRSHVWSAVPVQFEGAQFIRMRQGDKESASLAVEVTASQDITLLLLIDNRVGDNTGSGIDTSPPDFSTGKMPWVHAGGFVDSGIDVGIDESPIPGVTEVNSSTSVYLKHLASGQSFTFLEQNDGPTRSIYTIAAVAPQTWPFAFSANPATIGQGQSTTLQWNAPAGSAVTIDPSVGDLTGLTNAITGAGSVTITPNATTTYTLSYDPPGAAPLASLLPVQITVNLTNTPFEAWISTNYPALTGDDALPGSDPDGDGLNNLGEFAFGSNPTSGASDGRLAGRFATVNGSQAFTITLPARAGAVFNDGGPAISNAIDGLVYQVQAGTGLDTWATPVEEITGPDATAIQSTLPALPPGYSYHSFRLDVPPGTTRAFTRAHINGTAE